MKMNKQYVCGLIFITLLMGCDEPNDGTQVNGGEYLVKKDKVDNPNKPVKEPKKPKNVPKPKAEVTPEVAEVETPVEVEIVEEFVQCEGSELLGTWFRWVNSYSKKLYLTFEKDCSMIIPECAVKTNVTQNNGETVGRFEFEITKDPLNTDCYSVGKHACDFGVSNKTLFLTCEGYLNETYELMEEN